MKAWTRWQDRVSLVLGVILFITPWVFGTALRRWSSWDAWIIGILFVVANGWAFYKHEVYALERLPSTWRLT